RGHGRGTGSGPRGVTLPGAHELEEHAVERTEVVLSGLVGADVLGSDDGGEGAVEGPVAAGKSVTMYVGQDDQLIMTCKPGERIGGVGKSGPVRNRVAQTLRPFVTDLVAELVAGATECFGEHVGIERSRGLALYGCFVVGVSEQQVLVADVESLLACP